MRCTSCCCGLVVPLVLGVSFPAAAQEKKPPEDKKLRYSDQEHPHPRDASNLADHVSRTWTRDLVWDALDLRTASFEELSRSPVLFLSGSASLEPTATMVSNLKRYLNAGGTLLAEGCCDGKDFDKSFTKLVDQIYAESGGAENNLRDLPPTHPLWKADATVAEKDRKGLAGVEVDGRLQIVYSTTNLSCRWQHASPRRMLKLSATAQADVALALAIGQNVCQLATKRELKYRYESFVQKAAE